MSPSFISWSTLKTEAIVLTSAPFREADRLYAALTPSHGKISFVGRGARKGKAKLAAHLEPFAVVNIEIVRGRRSTTVISVERTKRFRGIESDFDKRLLATSSMHLLDLHMREWEEDEPLYREMMNWIEFLDESPGLTRTRATLILASFLTRVMAHLGYDLELDQCLSCHESILPLSYRWHAGRGGLVCSGCIEQDLEEWHAARVMPEEAVKLLRFVRSSAYVSLLDLGLSAAVLQEAGQAVHDVMTYHLPAETPVAFWEAIPA